MINCCNPNTLVFLLHLQARDLPSSEIVTIAFGSYNLPSIPSISTLHKETDTSPSEYATDIISITHTSSFILHASITQS